MNAQVQDNVHQYDADELSEFLLQCEEYGLEPEPIDDEYLVHHGKTGNLIAFFSEAPSSGPAGGWIRFTYFQRLKVS